MDIGRGSDKHGKYCMLLEREHLGHNFYPTAAVS